VALDNPALAAFGDFKVDTVPVSAIGRNQIPVQQMLDRVGYR
jgi:iron(III) transport system substrate-binding protein